MRIIKNLEGTNLNNNIYQNISELLQQARKNVNRVINSTIVYTYFEIGRMIVEEEQEGKKRAEYGKKLLETLSEKLTQEFGKGFSIRNIEQMRKFYSVYSKTQKVSAKFKLSWSHYIRLCRINNIGERDFYEIESINNNWSLKELNRHFDTGLYERLVLSRDKEEVRKLASHGQIIEKPKDIIKDPYVLEFLGLESLPKYSESTLENAIIDHVEKFIMELGKGFLFQGRQVKFTFSSLIPLLSSPKTSPYTLHLHS